MGWLIPPPWQPEGRPPVASIAMRVPLPGTTFINAANDVEFLQPILEGDRLTVVEELVSVSPEKQTRLGVGHFVETWTASAAQDGDRGGDRAGTRCSASLLRRRHDAWASGLERDQRARRPARGGRRDQLPAGGDERRSDLGLLPRPFRSRATPKAKGIRRFSSTPCIWPDSSTASRPTGPARTAGWCAARCGWLGSIYAGDSMVGRGRVVDKRCDTSVDHAAIPCRPPDRGVQPARRGVLPGRTHPAPKLAQLLSSGNLPRAHHRLQLDVFVEALGPELTPDARLLESAERAAGVEHVHVDAVRSGAHTARRSRGRGRRRRSTPSRPDRSRCRWRFGPRRARRCTSARSAPGRRSPHARSACRWWRRRTASAGRTSRGRSGCPSPPSTIRAPSSTPDRM